MKKHITTLLAVLASCTMSFAQWGGFGGGGFDFGGGGGASAGSLSSYTNKQNIDYVGDNHVGHKLDIYYPNDGKATHNVIIHIYGSAWGSNDQKGAADHGTVGKAALDAGYIFVTPNHRTYNDALWPAQINDIKAVVRYLRGNKEDLKIDDSFIGISGFSSGGHLASMMGVTNGETVVKVGSESIDIEGKLGKFTSECSAVDAVCDWSGPVDCRDKSCGNPINMSPENDMVGGCTPQSCPDKHATLGTNTYIDANDVPHMICHGTTDNIVPCCEGEKYANNLKKAGIYVEWYNPGHGHQVNGEYTDEMIKFFNKIREEKASKGIDRCGGSQGGQQGGDQGGDQGGQQGGQQAGDQGGQQGGTQGGSDVDPKEALQVYIAIGQSNMWGNATVQSSDKATHDRIKMMSTANSRGNVGSWIPAVPPMCAPGAGYSLADNFIRTMADGVPECVTIGVIPVAIAGASFKAFDPNQCGSYFSSSESWLQNMAKEYDNNPYKRIVECAKKAQETGVIKGIIVHQGESDSGQQAWLTMVQTFYNNLCKDLGLEPSKTPILVGQMLEGGACAGHNTVIAQLPSKISNCAVISSAGLSGESDRLHFKHDSYTEFGKRYAEKMLTMIDFDGKCPDGSAVVEPKESTPYKGVAAKLPGKIEAENYDEGGSNVAYYDLSSGNKCDDYTNVYRSDDVDIKKEGSDYIVGNCQSGEWMKYTVDVEEDGEYELTVRVGEGGNSGKFSLLMDDKSIDYTVNVEKTGAWGTYAEQIQSKKFNLKKGTHVLKLTIESDWVDIDWLKFTTEKTDVETIVKREFAIVPNPASTAIYIYSEGDIEGVSIMNAIGDVVAISNESRVDVSTLPNGIYFVKATIDGETAVKKLVVNK
ncbi:MAG: carbohydrate-binding protein [Bacteroidales bacterium]|nr:carbohydrate-binding protein [Candidatus Scybalocola fimicaballi]